MLDKITQQFVFFFEKFPDPFLEFLLRLRKGCKGKASDVDVHLTDIPIEKFVELGCSLRERNRHIVDGVELFAQGFDCGFKTFGARRK